MAEFTPNYRLHQWEPTDSFLRTDFNQDFSTIDTALGRAERNAEANAYNLYNLMLQNDYEGKYTGYKKALIFDGFVDDSGISEKSEALLMTGGSLILSKTAQGNLSLGGYGSKTGYNLDSAEVTASGVGILTGFQCKLINPYSESFTPTLQVILTINGEQVFSQKLTGQAMAGNATPVQSFSFGQSFTLIPGYRIQLRLENSMTQIYCASDGEHLAGTLLCTGRSASTAQLTSRAQELPTFQKALAWVRHKGGTVGLSLKCGGETVPLTAGDCRDAVDLLSGNACVEQSYRLEQDLSAGNWQVVLDVALDSGESGMQLHDYGIITM